MFEELIGTTLYIEDYFCQGSHLLGKILDIRESSVTYIDKQCLSISIEEPVGDHAMIVNHIVPTEVLWIKLKMDLI